LIDVQQEGRGSGPGGFDSGTEDPGPLTEYLWGIFIYVSVSLYFAFVS